jgi:hypothetical protein
MNGQPAPSLEAKPISLLNHLIGPRQYKTKPKILYAPLPTLVTGVPTVNAVHTVFIKVLKGAIRRRIEVNTEIEVGATFFLQVPQESLFVDGCMYVLDRNIVVLARINKAIYLKNKQSQSRYFHRGSNLGKSQPAG